ncbi:tail fiber domain-containing protein, partial [Candidatus Dojkabacteria bacterium]
LFAAITASTTNLTALTASVTNGTIANASTTNLTVTNNAYFGGNTGIWNGSGNVGVGTTIPGEQLTLSAATDNAIQIKRTGGVNNPDYKLLLNDAGNYFAIGRTGIANDLVLQGGKVGIGTTTPYVKLDIYNSDQSSAAPSLRSFTPNGTYGHLFEVGNTGLKVLSKDNGTLTFGRTASSVGYGRLTGSSAGISFSTSPDDSTYTEWMNLSSSGVLGIGTSAQINASNTPALLNVLGKIVAGDANSTTGSTILEGRYGTGGALTVLGTEQSSGGPVLGYAVSPSTSAPGAFLSSYGLVPVSRSAVTVSDGIKFYVQGSTSSPIGTPLSLTEAMKIATNGNVGIGTTSPSSKLEVAGKVTVTGANIRLSNNYFLTSNTVAGVEVPLISRNTSDRVSIDGDGYGTIFGGNVGIGTTTPDHKLTIYDSDSNALLLDAASITTQRFARAGQIKWGFLNNHAGADYFGLYDYIRNDYVLTFKPNGDSYFKNGNVGIGTTSPSSKLDVWGDFRVGTSSTPTLFANTATGNVGVGISSPAATFQVGGAVSSGRYFQVDNVGRMTIRYDDNSLQNSITLRNSGVTTNAHGAAILAQLSDNAATGINAGRIGFLSENATTTFASTSADAAITFATAQDASLSERMRLTSAGSLHIGAGGTSTASLRISKVITGGTSAYSTFQDGVIQSDVTTDVSYNRTVASTAAASFTLPTLYHYNATQAAFGAGSTVTNQIGFFAENTLTGATNNYGFYGAIASSTGRYNLYMPGTAANYLAGSLGIGTANPTAILSVASSTAAGTTSIFSVSSSASLFNILANGNLGIGTTTPTRSLDVYGTGAWNGSGGIRVQGNNPGVEIADLASGNKWLIANGVNSSSDGFLGLAYDIDAAAHRIVVDGTGKVGIGSTAPGYKLTVNPATSYTGLNTGDGLQINGGTIGTAANLVLGLSGTNSNAIQSRDGTSSSYPLAINPFGGNVGIGTTSPRAKLSVANGNYNWELSPGASTTLEAINLADTNARVDTGFYTRNGDFTFNTASYSERMRITNAGNVGIGTSNPGDTRLRVTGSGEVFKVDDGSSPFFKVNTTTGYSTFDNGNVGIGTTTPSEKLEVNGFARINGVRVDPSIGLDQSTYFTLQPHLEGGTFPLTVLGGNAPTATTSNNTSTPFGTVAYNSGYGAYISDFIPVQPGETLYGEMWAMRQTGSSGTAGVMYMGVARYDKDKKPISTINALDYFVAYGETVPQNSTWTKYSGTKTLSTSHVPFEGSDGGPVRYVRAYIIQNYTSGTIPTYWAGAMIRRVSLTRDTGIARIAGNLMVGNAVERARLSVSGSVISSSIPLLGNYDGSTVAYLSNGDTNYGLLTGVLGTGDVWQQAQRTDGISTAYNLLLQPTGGNVGISTTTPSLARLVVDGGASTVAGLFSTQTDNQITLHSSNSWTGIRFDDGAVGDDFIWFNGSNSTFAIGGDGSNVSGKKLHIDGGTTIGVNYDAVSGPNDGLYVEGQTWLNGNVGIGTTTPGYSFSNVNFTRPIFGTSVRDWGGSTPSSNALVWGFGSYASGSGYAAAIYNDRNCIGTGCGNTLLVESHYGYANPTNPIFTVNTGGFGGDIFVVKGSGYAVLGNAVGVSDGNVLTLTDNNGSCTHNPGSSSEAVSCSSDERLKNTIRDTSLKALSYIDDFRIRDFKLNAETNGNDHVGVIAQEVLVTHPELVITGDDGLYKVTQPNPWVLVKGIQELSAAQSVSNETISLYPALEAVDAGTVVAFGSSTVAWEQATDSATSTQTYQISGVRKATDGYEAIGVISTKAGITLGG